jgi:ABC-type spermidine/putrescine transport systems, ATPase components
MSDRLAVFNRGRIEQVGSPADVVRTPGDGLRRRVRRCLQRARGGDRCRDRRRSAPLHDPTGEDLDDELDAPVDGDSCTATGHVREVVYLGATTRYIIELDVGDSLVVMEQNLTTSSMEALQVRGKAVRLIWRRSNNRPVEAPAGAREGSMDQEEAQAS